MKPFYLKIHAALQLVLLLSAGLVSQATAGFTSIYVFGDGVCTTTASPSPAYRYYGGRFCNGKVWIETLSQWQGVNYNSAKNNSFFGHSSSILKTSASSLSPPADAATSLFIVWCADADFVYYATNIPWNSGSSDTWNSSITQSINDHTAAINTLYSKGARLIVMPNAANVGSIPLYNTSKSQTEKNFFRNRVISFNTQFLTAMNALAASKGDLKIIVPDVFTFFEHVQTNFANYGMEDPIPNNAAVVAYPSTASATAGSPGSNFIFWDSWHPTAKFQMHLAAFIQQSISPVKVNSVSLSGGNVQIQLANIPLGRAGAIQGSANLQPPWAQDYPFTEPFVAGGSTNQTYSFPAVGSKRFYRAAFPVVWVWP